jgi:xylulokinase
MTPYWNSQARGTITGLNASHGRGHVYRATLEGISLEQTIATNRAAEASGMQVDHYVAIGGGSNSDLWCQILADASGRKVVRSATVEASALGAAMAAAHAAGWFTSVEEASAEMAGELTSTFTPERSSAARYRELLNIYSDLWPTLAAWNTRLVSFLDNGPAN